MSEQIQEHVYKQTKLLLNAREHASERERECMAKNACQN